MLPAMKRETVLALNALNQAFYAEIAAEWSESRKSGWPGFERVYAPLAPRARAQVPLRVLDVGAGDGRFAAWLAQRTPNFEYLGIDASESLLSHARERGLGAHVRFEQRDFISTEGALPGGRFDLVLLLGVLHHVPAFALRRLLVSQLASRVAVGGRFALTFWRLDGDPRFESRIRPWAEQDAVDPSDLEPGDQLLGWGESAALRYCHFPDQSETDALIAAAGLVVVDRFHADGRGGILNEYVVFART